LTRQVDCILSEIYLYYRISIYLYYRISKDISLIWMFAHDSHT